MAVLRKHSASNSIRKATESFSESEKSIEAHQMHHLVFKYATYTTNGRDGEKCQEFLALLGEDRTTGLGKEQAKKLRNMFEQIADRVLSKSKIVASTLSNPANDVLRVTGSFSPDILICDESGQCLEGDI